MKWYAICYEREDLCFASRSDDCKVALFPLALAKKVASRYNPLVNDKNKPTPLFLTPREVLNAYHQHSSKILLRLEADKNIQRQEIGFDVFKSNSAAFQLFKTMFKKSKLNLFLL